MTADLKQQLTAPFPTVLVCAIRGYLWIGCLLWMVVGVDSVSAQTLQRQLLAETRTALARAAREHGDARRGAVVFYQPYLACTRCHISGKRDNPLGPDLTKIDQDTSDIHLIESILEPSKVIRQGFEPMTLVTAEGKTVTGILSSDNGQQIAIRVVGQNFKTITFKKHELEEIGRGKVSIMPEGQVNVLTSRQQFLDLVRYLIEIRDGGVIRARELEPPPSSYAVRPLAKYEKHIDHAGMLRDLDHDAFQRGRKIYNRLCINCHGTHDRPGSLPTSLRFASGKFKNGHDPFTMYQTLTRGFGMMVPQTWMVPQQKYDVIHYVREAYLRDHNPSQYATVGGNYLASLPRGDTRGPAPSKILEWEQMDYGPNLVMTLEIGDGARNFAYKGNAIRLDVGPGGVSQGRHWMVYDYDTLRVAAAWSGSGFCDWNGINFNGRHAIHPRIVGTVYLANPTGPGWGRTQDGGFADDRMLGRDGRMYGPLPRSWAHYKGMYYHGPHTIIECSVADTRLLEMPGVITSTPVPVFTRTLNIGARRDELVLQVAHRDEPQASLSIIDTLAVFGVGDAGAQSNPAKTANTTRLSPRSRLARGWTIAGIAGDVGGLSWLTDRGNLRLRIPAGNSEIRFTLWFTTVANRANVEPLADVVVFDEPDQDLRVYTRGGVSRWPEVLTTSAILGDEAGSFAVDVIQRPVDNPWFCRLRLTGFDFTADGREAVVCTWDGNIWRVGGLHSLTAHPLPDKARPVPITWRRIASGLFQPLGVKIVDGKIYVNCRDQICILHDLNGDGEIDYFENFNNDHQVTDHFHEFAMGLQVDSARNFYYAKSARHALTALVPHHGTLLRVSPDGSRTDIIATGFRAANGVCVNPDGTFIVTDQEGHWNPKNRINWVKPGGFYGNMFGYHDVTDSSDAAMQQPLCWITNAFDRSPSELLWVDSERWGSLNGSLLNFSYGYGKVYIVPHEKINGQMQGGMCQLPIPEFPTGVMRGRFQPQDGQLYTCGMFAWAGSQTQPGGFYRIRHTGKPTHLPVRLNAKKDGMQITFSSELDLDSASDAGNYRVKVWSLKRTAKYGSKHYDEHSIKVVAARLSEDNKTVLLEIPEIKPTWCMEIKYAIKAPGGTKIIGTIHNTVHQLGE